MLRPMQACALVLGAASPLAAQVAAGRSVVRGTVTNTAGRPLPGARVVRFGTSDTARADSSGHFAIEHLALGRHIFVVRQSGYQPIEMEVTFTNDTTISVDIPLEQARAGFTAKLARVGFIERRRQAGAGSRDATFIGTEEIAAKAATQTSQLLVDVPDINVRRENLISVVYGIDKRCIMSVWLDGQRIEDVFPPMVTTSMTQTRSSQSVRGSYYAGLDDLIHPADIAAIEIYPRPARMPSQFQVPASQQMVQRGLQHETHTAECGAIVIWSAEEQ